MAGIDSLKNRIIEDEEEQAKKLLDEARIKADVILGESRKKADVMLAQAKVRGEKDGKDSKERILSRAHMDARNNILSAKQEMIDKVFMMAKDRLYSMGKDEYINFIEKLLLNNVETGEEEIIFSDNDLHRIDPGLVERINDRLTLSKRKGCLKISTEKADIKSGFVLKHGGIEKNCSIESEIRMLRDSLEGEIARILFKDA